MLPIVSIFHRCSPLKSLPMVDNDKVKEIVQVVQVQKEIAKESAESHGRLVELNSSFLQCLIKGEQTLQREKMNICGN